jgi:amino-acid N-acetyltransferase
MTPVVTPTTATLRKARTEDAAAIQRLINGFAERDLMLPRSLSQLYENVRDFFVVDDNEAVAGCAALHVSWKDLAELKSLAVDERFQGRGYGRDLIHACVDEARDLGIARVFALTYVPELFERFGWTRVDKATLPRKVWTECVYCPKFSSCTEVAVVLDLTP